MKKILPFLLFPILIFGQFPATHQNNSLHFQFLIDVSAEKNKQNQAIPSDNLNGVIEVFITVELYFEDLTSRDRFTELRTGTIHKQKLPKHLTSFSLLRADIPSTDPLRLNTRLNYLLAQNDPENPREDAIWEWLSPVRYNQSTFRDPKHLPAGFGPSIRL